LLASNIFKRYIDAFLQKCDPGFEVWAFHHKGESINDCNFYVDVNVTTNKMKKLNQTFLFIYSLLTTMVFIISLIWFSRQLNHNKVIFDKIEAQQIRIIEPDGTLRMIISNHSKFPGIIVKGKEEPFVRPQAGMLFYNDEGSENGGLIFGGSKNDKGEVINSGGSLSFDRYMGNQEVQLIGVNDKDDRFAGLMISDSHPAENKDPSRIWVGRNENGSSEIALMDSSGNKRLILQVLPNGKSSMTFLDEKGKILNSLNPN